MSKKLTTAEFIEKARKIHGNKYDYSESVYGKDNKQKLKIICSIHGNFWQIPNCHLCGKGCSKCSYSLTVMTTDLFIEKAKKVHGYKYDYSIIDYKNNRKKVEIICKTHGSFFQTPIRHLAGSGCLQCYREKQHLSPSLFIKKSNKIHDNFYNYSKVNYEKSNKKIEISCPLHGSFFQRASSHLMGCGCPKCNHRISKSELEFLDYLKIPNTKENRQVKILGKNIDGFDNRTNTIYEFLGDYWHGNPEKYMSNSYNSSCKKTFGKLYENTFKKFNKLKSVGYNVKYIWENDWKKFKKNINNIPKILNFDI